MTNKEFEEEYGMTKKEARRLDKESLAWEDRFEKAEMKRERKRERKEDSWF